MRLIDADAVEKITWQDPSYTDPLNVLTEVREKVRALPTVDAVPVIRCKDCKHWQCDDYETYCDELGIFGTDMNSFCSYAKRK